jgi:DNA topoisomerase IB
MADRDGLGDLPSFNMNVLPGHNEIQLEESEEDDYQYITKMYSSLAQEILEFIEDVCDRLEYDGSMMFDEYMDRTSVMAMADKVYEKVKYHEKENVSKKDSILYQMIMTLMGGDMCHRRNRYRRKKQMFS